MATKLLPGANVHILGVDVLKRFNTVIYLQRSHVHLKPNGLYSAACADAERVGNGRLGFDLEAI